MRLTKKNLLITAICSLFLVGCGKEQDESSSIEKEKPTERGDVEPNFLTVEPEEQLPEPIANQTAVEEEANDAPEPEEELSKVVIALMERADNGAADAQYVLADKYAHGNGVTKDLSEAVRYYRLAAEQGRSDAQYNLGMHYETGYGVEKDPAEAAKWYEMANESQESN
jgi:hypothetical protein